MEKTFSKLEINLLPEEMRKKIVNRRERTRLKLAFAGSFLSLLILFYTPVILVNSYESRLENKKSSYEAGQKNYELLVQLQDEKQRYRELQESLSLIAERTVSPLELLESLGQLLPAGVQLKSFHLRGKQRLDLTFQVQDPLQVAKLSVLLGELNSFEIEDLTSVPLAEGNETVSYILFFN